jgi:tetratricopeptide (TPR) repeat protein
MASASKIAANRRNAQKSTGPRSIAGKARSRRNAFRHGLAIPVTRDIFNADLIERLARQLIDEAATPDEQEHAQLAAEAEAEILRARQAKVDLLNRAAQNLADPDLRIPDEIMAFAFAAKFEDLSAFERYERRALSKRKWALRVLTAVQHANDAHKRNVSMFREAVARLDVTAVVKTALAHPHEARYSELAGWSGETYGVTLDLRSAGLARVNAFIQCRDAASGCMRVRMTDEGNETVTQTFAIATRSMGVDGRRWIAICPTTERAVANLYVRAGERELKSRHALKLHYQSRHRGADQGRRGRRWHETDQSHGLAMVEYAAIVAAISGQAKPHTTPTRPWATDYDALKDERGLRKERDIAQPEDKSRRRSKTAAQPDRHSGHRRHSRDHQRDSAIIERHEVISLSAQCRASDHQSNRDPIPIPTVPTAPPNLHATLDIDGGSLPIGSVDAASVQIDVNGLKAGDVLAAAGQSDAALAVYQRYAAVCRVKVANRSSIRAIEQLDIALSRIGRLTQGFLLSGAFERALNCADEALAAHPKSVVLNINRAHALMFLGRVAQAQEIYLRYRGKKMPPRGKSCDNFILQGFVQLRQTGLSQPLMDEIEQGSVETEGTNQPSAETFEPIVETVEPTVNKDESQITVTRLAEIERGNQLVAEEKLEEALVSYRCGLTVCKARIQEDGTAPQAQHDLDLVVWKIAGLAFRFLLVGRAAQALHTIEEALSYRQHWVWLHAIRAHALLCLANVTEARKIYQRYRGVKVDEKTTWEDIVRGGFDQLRKSGRKYPLMDFIEKEFRSNRY